MRKAANLQLTRECNNECVFCSNPQFEKEFSLEEATKKIIELKKEGVNEIFLTGGEPTLVNFLSELIDYIIKQGINPKLITNGVKLSDKEFVKKLYNAGLREINISIHSHDEEIADKLSQKKGHFKKTLSGIRNAIDFGMDVQINSTINSLNCKYLEDYVRFFIENFSGINHFIFNNLDPGNADGILKSRAGENSWIVPKFVDFELEIQKMVKILKKHNKTFRIENIPLCYMPGFEEFSTETRKIIKGELYICSFIQKGAMNKIKTTNPLKSNIKLDVCDVCNLNSICAGIQKEYIDIHGSKEIFPVFINPKKIVDKIKA